MEKRDCIIFNGGYFKMNKSAMSIVTKRESQPQISYIWEIVMHTWPPQAFRFIYVYVRLECFSNG